MRQTSAHPQPARVTRKRLAADTTREISRGPSVAWRAGAVLLLGLGAGAGCKEAAGSTPEGSASLRAGQVTLSADEIRRTSIVVEPMSDQEIDDTLVTSARVTF